MSKKLTISEARELSKKIKDQPVLDMLLRAKTEVKNWERPSRQNKGFTVGVFWNILDCKKYLDGEVRLSQIAKYRFLVQFGEFLEDNYKTQKKKRPSIKPTHQDPKF